MHQAINGGRGGHRVLEDVFPSRKGEIAGEHHAASLVTFRQECEQDFHLFSALLHVADVINDDRIEF